MQQAKLFMILIGCKPEGRHTEQHDIFFGIADSLPALVPHLHAFWPDGGRLHIDAWREVTQVDGYAVTVVEKNHPVSSGAEQLFFINLGGYKEKEFEEYHYKILAVAKEKGDAIQQSKQTAFYKHVWFEGATSHIDDKYGVDVDDIYEITDIMPGYCKERYSLEIRVAENVVEDEWHLGYTKLSSLVENSHEP